MIILYCNLVYNNLFTTKFYIIESLLFCLGFQCHIGDSFIHLVLQKVCGVSFSFDLRLVLAGFFRGDRGELQWQICLKSIFACLIFFYSFSCVKTYSVHSRILGSKSFVDLINRDLDQIEIKPWLHRCGCIFKDFGAVEVRIFERVPVLYPSTGILKRVSLKY